MKVKIALDWHPNTIHAGLYLAQSQGYLAADGISRLEIISPETDHYATYPIERLISGEVDVALAPTEHLLEQVTKGHADLRLLATIFQQDTSCFLARADRGIRHPHDLDGRRYAAYGILLEDEMVKRLIRADGGQGEVQRFEPGKLSVWDAYASGQVDFIWGFRAWELALAQHLGIPTVAFDLAEAQVPYSYSPCLICRQPDGDKNEQALPALLQALARGYTLAESQPDLAAALLAKEAIHPSMTDAHFLERSLRLVNGQFCDLQQGWGQPDMHKVNDYAQWLRVNGLMELGELDVMRLKCG